MSGKKTNAVPIHKKNDKQVLSNYRSVFLLPVCSKIFERLIYDSVYKHIGDNNLLSPSQSGFCIDDSCVNQLLSITYDIFHCFDEGIETRAIKALDKVWQSLLTDFLSNRKQRVVLNG